MSRPPLTVSRVDRELTITGKFNMREVNGKHRWVISIAGAPHGPSIELAILSRSPDYDNRVAVAVFHFITLENAESVTDQLVDAGYAYSASASPALQKASDWLPAYVEGARKYNRRTQDQEAVDRYNKAVGVGRSIREIPPMKCNECGNSGWYEGFNVKRERCSRGCKP